MKSAYPAADGEALGRWTERQQALHALIRDLGVDGQPWRVDLAAGRVAYYVDEEPVLVAEAKLLCTWGLRTRALVMGWANAGIVGGAVIEPLDGFEPRYVSIDAHAAEAIAIAAADRVGADAFHRVADGSVWAWFGLWSPRRATEADRAMVAGPEPFVARLIASLIAALDRDDPHADDLAARCANSATICDRVAADPDTDAVSAARLYELAAELRSAAPAGSEALDLPARAEFAAAVNAAGARFDIRR